MERCPLILLSTKATTLTLSPQNCVYVFNISTHDAHRLLSYLSFINYLHSQRGFYVEQLLHLSILEWFIGTTNKKSQVNYTQHICLKRFLVYSKKFLVNYLHDDIRITHDFLSHKKLSLHGFWGSNSGPHACTANPLLTEPSLQIPLQRRNLEEETSQTQCLVFTGNDCGFFISE